MITKSNAVLIMTLRFAKIPLLFISTPLLVANNSCGLHTHTHTQWSTYDSSNDQLPGKKNKAQNAVTLAHFQISHVLMRLLLHMQACYREENMYDY